MGSLRKKKKSPGNCRNRIYRYNHGNALMLLRGERTEKILRAVR
jgi:hypothetical protein